MKYVRASAGRSGLQVVFEGTSHPRHDGDIIYLPEVTVDTTEDQLEQMMVSTDHEVGHDRHSDFGILKKEMVDMNSPLGHIWNVIEDSRVNALEAQEYYGFKQLWNKCAAKQVDKIISNFKTIKSVDKTKLDFIGSLLKWDGAANEYLFPNVAQATKDVKSDPKIDGVLSKYTTQLLKTHEIADKIVGTKATFDLAVEIFEALGGKKEDCQAQPKPDRGKGKKGKGKDKKKSASSEEGNGEEGAAGDEAESGEENTPKDYTSDFKIVEMTINESDIKAMGMEERPHDGRFSKVGLKHKSDHSGSGDWTVSTPENFVVVDYPNQVVTGNSISSGLVERALKNNSHVEFTRNFNDRVGNKAVISEQFAQQVRRLIQIRAKDKYEYGVKRGKLDQSRLSRVCFDTPGFNERIFKRKITNDVLDASVSVLIDMSGSMGGDKVLNAAEAALLLNTVFSHALHIPVEIVGFTDLVGGFPLQFVYKGFNTNKVDRDTLLKYIGTSSSLMNGNPDGENILWTYDRLKKQKTKKKLLIVCSDGQPAANRGISGLSTFTKKVISEIEKEGIVDIYGLGILSNAVTSYYKHHSVISSPEEIPSKLIEVIERKLLNDY